MKRKVKKETVRRNTFMQIGLAIEACNYAVGMFTKESKICWIKLNEN